MSIRKILAGSFVSFVIGCSSSPAATVTVTPSSATVTAGDQPMVFTATVSNPEAIVTWSLAGDGSLSVSAGPAVTYTPPASVTAVETATLTATLAGASAPVIITINPVGAGVTTRTVSSKVQTQFMKDDGTTTLVPGWSFQEMGGAAVTALLVPDSSAAGYTSFPVTVAADGTFSVANVPSGAYFIQVDQTIKVIHSAAVERTLYRATSSNPDLTLFVHGRADRTTTTSVLTPLQINVTGLSPLADLAAAAFPSSSQVFLTVPQISIFNFGLQNLLTPKPQPGDTSLNGSIKYGEALYLADASKGDVTYVYQRDHQELGTGATAASYYFTSKALRSDTLTVTDVTGGTLSGAMTAVPQTGSVHADLKLSQFAALASAVHPTAQPSAGGPPGSLDPTNLTVFTLFHAPPLIERVDAVVPLAVLNLNPQITADVDYGTLTYGRLPQSNTSDYVQFVYNYDLTLPGLTAGGDIASSEVYIKQVLVSDAVSGFAPALSPARAPLLDGKDALKAQAGVGLTPLISWTAPATGTPSAYGLQLFTADAGDVLDGEVALVNVVGLNGTSFKVPPGWLVSGRTYVGQISASSGGADAGSPILQNPFATDVANVDFGLFAP
jgi:hypothetical protein